MIEPITNSPTDNLPKFEKLVARFLNEIDAKKTSRDVYKRQIKLFMDWLKLSLPNISVEQLTYYNILSYRDHLISRGKSAYTVGGYLSIVKQFFVWLDEEEICSNVAKRVKNVQKPKGFRKDCLTIDQIKEALSSFNTGTEEGSRDYALFNLLVRTGLRTVEVSRALVEDIRQEGGEAILLVQGKGRDSKDDFVILVEETLKPIRKYLSMRRSQSNLEPLFTSMSDRTRGKSLSPYAISWIIKESFRKIHLNDSRLTAHSLRHTAVSLSIRNGASIVQAQAMARHSDPKTTMIYFHNHDRIKSGAERYVII